MMDVCVCIWLENGWRERRLKSVCSKKRLIIRRDREEEKKRILYYSKRPLNTEAGSW